MPTRSPTRGSAFVHTGSGEKFVGMEHFVEQELAERREIHIVEYFTFRISTLSPQLLGFSIQKCLQSTASVV